MTGEPQPSALAQSVHQLVSDAARDLEDRRDGPRLPYFRPIQLAVDGEAVTGDIFIVDIGPSSVGLLSSQPLETRVVDLHVTIDDKEVSLPARIVWSRELGNGWFRAGAAFESVG